MIFRALAVKPENAQIFLEELDLIIDYKTINKAYLVHGFPPPVEYVFYTKEEFDEEWRFLFQQENVKRFTQVIPTEGNRGV